MERTCSADPLRASARVRDIGWLRYVYIYGLACGICACGDDRTACASLRVHVGVRVHICASACVRACVCFCVRVRASACIWVWVHACKCARACASFCDRVQVCTHKRVRVSVGVCVLMHVRNVYCIADTDELGQAAGSCPAVQRLVDSDSDSSEDDAANASEEGRSHGRADDERRNSVVLRNNVMRLMLRRGFEQEPDAAWIVDVDKKLGIGDIKLTRDIARDLVKSQGQRHDLVDHDGEYYAEWDDEDDSVGIAHPDG